MFGRLRWAQFGLMFGAVSLGMTACVLPADEPVSGGVETAGAKERPAVDPAHPLAKALEKAYSAREALNTLDDYEAVFTKRELINRKVVMQQMQLKLREKPFSVYLKFMPPYAEGREVLFVDGRNNGQLVAREVGIRGLVGNVSLKPNSPDAMADNRYPVTMIGLRKMIDQVIAQWEAEAQFGECDVQFFPDAKFGDVECLAIESKHPKPRNQFKFHITRLFIDDKTNMAFRVEQYGFPVAGSPELPVAEEYTYTKIHPNVKLAEQDFDVKNPKYLFSK